MKSTIRPGASKISLMIIFMVSMCTTSLVLADCVAIKNLNPIQSITAISNRTAELAKKVDSAKSGEKAIPLLIECAKQLNKLSVTINKDLKNLMRKIDKNDKKAKQDILKQVSSMMISTRAMTKEIALAEKRVPALNIKGQIAPNKKKPTPTHQKTQVTQYNNKTKPKAAIKKKQTIKVVAKLEPRNLDDNPDTIEAYYDAKTNLTWLANANAAAGSTFDNGSSITDGKMSWPNAKDWVASLNVNGITGWRLPTTKQPDVTCVGRHKAFKCTGSEMGYFYHHVLGGKTGSHIFNKHNTNYDYFDNISKCPYWSATEYARLPRQAWQFEFRGGKQQRNSKLDNFGMACAWAVHSGDVGRGKNN